jgi:hypothetical protein
MRRIKLLLVLAMLAIVPASAQIDEHQLQDRLRTAVREYRTWGRVDDLMRWAPYDCELPPPSQARISTTGDHARKIYFVYARDRIAYSATTERDAPTPIGQIVIKESFHPRAVAGPTYPSHSDDDPHLAFSPASENGHFYGPGDYAGLFVMQYLGPRAPRTDRGWVYGTIAPSGEVTSFGLVPSCMGCHRQAPHGGLFGLH